MENNFFDSKEFTEVKIFGIDKDFYELKTINSNEKIIQHIVDKHRKLVKDSKSIGKPIPGVSQDKVTYYSYVYNETIKDSYWKKYLPSSITENQNFEIKKLSFTLFAIVDNRIFVIVGGGGIRVIKRYINNRFGLEFYEYLTNPQDDIVISLTVRGISGRLTEQREIYRNGQSLLDAISFTEIPMSINLKLREDLKNSIFDFIDFSSEDITIEVGSYFFIKQRIKFSQLHELFVSINNTMNNHTSQSLSSFEREKDSARIEDKYKTILCEELRGDMMNYYYTGRKGDAKKFDIDFIHPSKIQEFYECNRFELKAKKKKKPFFETTNRELLYSEGLRYLYNQLGDNSSQFDFNAIVFGIRVYGYRDNELRTEAMFLQHITCEIRYLNTPIFQIDNNWYKVKNDFVETINDRCYSMIDKNILPKGVLTIPWDDTLKDEDQFNMAYSHKPNCYVFDKMLGQNIEFCDIMVESDNAIYLVHVKDGFDAKIRDLANQLLISATRYWNDINSKTNTFLESVITSYNNSKPIPLDKQSFINKFKANKDIVFVMAYNSRKPELTSKERITKSRSNIAKYSLIQCSQDMTSLFNLKIIDIADI